ncbi:MAG TPA: glycerol-3-phosphate dehydrogenase [Pyrinomonadaceae bacterium]|nr:glycerol-3-phosphate dehydrogenase [Pyrinomonadaceae bacterium]
MTSRPANISEITFDVIIIGAGINGAGIARDAAMRGLQVLMLDKGDIGGGTSSWSTRLIHGGLRYLEHAELGLVRESLRERETLFRIAPHLVKPLPILLPLYEQAVRGPLTIRAGMIAYDMLSLDKSLPRHRMLTRDEALAQAPGLNRKGLRGAAIYYDAQVEYAERLVVENVLSAKEHGATVVTYVKVETITPENDSSSLVGFTGVLSGETFVARARIVVNASGPWIDKVLAVSQLLASAAPSKLLIGGTKGSHIIVAPFAGASTSALYVEARSDSRPFFIIPWNGHYLIGTTDIRYEGDLDRVEIEANEIDYLLSETNSVISTANLTRDSILFTYSGVRPLAFTGDQDAQSITRRHFIRRHPHFRNLFSIVGGKLTTYRSLAEQAMDLVCRELGKRAIKCSTADARLPGAQRADFAVFSENFKSGSGLPEAISDRLLRTYGTRSSDVLELIPEDPALAEIFDAQTGAIAAEVVFAFKSEMAQTLSDCLLRRTMVGLNSNCGVDAAEAAARIAQKHLGWSETRVDQETAAYRNEINRRFRGQSRI